MVDPKFLKRKLGLSSSKNKKRRTDNNNNGNNNNNNNNNGDSSSEDEIVNQLAAETHIVNKPRELLQRTNQLRLQFRNGKQQDLPFVETLIMESTPLTIDNAEDDIRRELLFYNHSLDAAVKAQELCRINNIKFTRPDDYFAEMVKTDKHMMKVKEKLAYDTRRVELAEERRKKRELKKVGKHIQTEKLKERAMKKNQDIEAIKRWRTLRERGEIKESELPAEFLEENPVREKTEEEKEEKRKRRKEEKERKKQYEKKELNNKNKSKKRVEKDKVYGFGGKKRDLKRNTAESTNDIKHFPNFKKQNENRGGNKGGNKGGKVTNWSQKSEVSKGKKRRLGKNKRMSKRRK